MSWRLNDYIANHSFTIPECVEQDERKLTTMSHSAMLCYIYAYQDAAVLLLLLNPFNGLFSRTTWVSGYQKGETSLDLNEVKDDGVLWWQWHQLDHMQTICTSLQTDNHTNISSLNVYRPDARSDDQPTVSKHWRQQAATVLTVKVYTAAATYRIRLKISAAWQIFLILYNGPRHTHPFNNPLSGTTRMSRYQKGKTNLDFTEARDSEWQWHQPDHMQVCTSLQTDNHDSTPLLSFLQAGCPSCCPTNSVKALKANTCTPNCPFPWENPGPV